MNKSSIQITLYYLGISLCRLNGLTIVTVLTAGNAYHHNRKRNYLSDLLS